MLLSIDEIMHRSNERAVLLFSGGFDSTLVGMILKEIGIKTVALSINYLTRPSQERQTSLQLAARLDFESYVELNLPLKDLRLSPAEWPSERYEAWFPYRNVIFFSLAANFAYFHKCSLIASGIREWDSPAYNDSSPQFLAKLEQLLECSGHPDSPPPGIFLPLLESDALARDYLAREGEISQILKQTRSCWRKSPDPCGECVPCKERARFFSELERKEDPSNERPRRV
jgi:7-cyano-7-deazaguanine synthase